MNGFIDLHCHWVAGIDDGAKSPADGIAMLQGLKKIGFDMVVATPHMRPGMFDNDRDALQTAYDQMAPAFQGQPGLPEVALSCEHYFNDVVFDRIMAGQALPYPGDRAILIEFHSDHLPARITERLFDLRRKGLRPVIAHPERYAPVWKRISVMEDLVDRGTVLLLDIQALVGKYGRSARRCAEDMLENGLYYAACTDAHKVADIEAVSDAIRTLRKAVGDEETQFLLTHGPRAVLEGKVDL